MRRHSSVGTSAISIAAQSHRHGTSDRVAASNSASSGITATSAQSRQTRRGGGGDAAGACHSELSRRVMPS